MAATIDPKKMIELIDSTHNQLKTKLSDMIESIKKYIIVSLSAGVNISTK
jgi:hypothetical protein